MVLSALVTATAGVSLDVRLKMDETSGRNICFRKGSKSRWNIQECLNLVTIWLISGINSCTIFPDMFELLQLGRKIRSTATGIKGTISDSSKHTISRWRSNRREDWRRSRVFLSNSVQRKHFDECIEGIQVQGLTID